MKLQTKALVVGSMTALVGILSPAVVFAAGNGNITRTVLQTVPNADTTHPSGLTQGDEWRFRGSAGQTFTLSVDTRDDDGAGNSLLDPVLVLKRPNGSVAAFEDDNIGCSRDPICGFSCPEVVTALDTTGWWTIVVRDFNTATTTSVQCIGGGYNLNVTGPSSAVESLEFNLDDGAVADPPNLQRQLEARKGK